VAAGFRIIPALGRVHLGHNWSVPQTLRKDHELVTSGPYRLVRHPIYTGIMLALLSTAFAYGPL
jgi:protein-S-isoprenylcysteine O-methyltransferase Ste14